MLTVKARDFRDRTGGHKTLVLEGLYNGPQVTTTLLVALI